MWNNFQHTSNDSDDKRLREGGQRRKREGNLRESRGFWIMHPSISKQCVEDFAVFDSEWRHGPRLKRHFGLVLSTNVSFTSGTLWLRPKFEYRPLKRKSKGCVLMCTRKVGKFTAIPIFSNTIFYVYRISHVRKSTEIFFISFGHIK